MTGYLSVSPQSWQSSTRAETALVTLVRFAGFSDCSDSLSLVDADDMQSFNSQFDLLGRLIDATDIRQRAIGHNIANVNTPNYRRIDVEFEAQLKRELSSKATSNKDAAIAARPVVVEDNRFSARTDGNNVNIDHEMGQQQKNAMLHQTYMQLLSTFLDQMRTAIEG